MQGQPVAGPGAMPPGGTGLTPQPTPTPTPSTGANSPFGSSGAFGTPAGTPIGPIMGVYSKSKKKAYKVFQGHDTYSDWRFTVSLLTGVGATTPGNNPGGVPGPGLPPVPKPN